jgi:HPt (histidine-containing phosphotransfer) domain-containing protein
MPGAPGEHEWAVVRARLDELLGDRSEREVALVARLLDGFPAKAADLLDRWFTAAANGHHDEAARYVHTLRGAALNLGSVALSEACALVELRPPSLDPGALATHQELLTAAVAAFSITLANQAATGDFRSPSERSQPSCPV